MSVSCYNLPTSCHILATGCYIYNMNSFIVEHLGEEGKWWLSLIIIELAIFCYLEMFSIFFETADDGITPTPKAFKNYQIFEIIAVVLSTIFFIACHYQ